ncbi:hypothetical protein Tco_0610601 [Tanacetum coccineum]
MISIMLTLKMELSSKEPLSKLINYRDVYNARFNNNDTVDMLYDGSKWKWPSEWTQKYHVLLLADRICFEKRMKYLNRINWKTDTKELNGCLDVGIKEKRRGLDGDGWASNV